MQRRGFNFLPLLIAAIVVLFYFMRAERFQNPETGKTALVAFSPQQESELGLQTFREVLSQSRVVDSGPEVEMVRGVAKRLVQVVDEESKKFEWAVSVVSEDQKNAFCLPGGKIVVYTGILPICQSDAGLATVMGHEIAHATMRHGGQRVFQTNMVQIAMVGLTTSMSEMDPQQRATLAGLLGAGAQFGVLLPFGREHELEADAVGLKYMARAGFDPRESVRFWERMREASDGQKPPEFMSTHPGDETRIQRLEAMMPEAVKIYQEAVASQGAGQLTPPQSRRF
jgi:predicted Zn-dependent protease